MSAKLYFHPRDCKNWKASGGLTFGRLTRDTGQRGDGEHRSQFTRERGRSQVTPGCEVRGSGPEHITTPKRRKRVTANSPLGGRPGS